MTGIYFLILALLLIGVFGVITQKNLIKIIISVSIIEAAVNLFLIFVGYRAGGEAPIITERFADTAEFARLSVDPFPQAMVLTSIVISVSLTALLIVISLRLYHIYGTYDINRIWGEADPDND